MKAPVRDRKTVPWMSSAEIPAVKLVLSEWRKLRRNRRKDAYRARWQNLERSVKDAAVLMQYVYDAERDLLSLYRKADRK